MKTVEIIEKIKFLATIPGSHYFNVDLNEDVTVKIRVSDHSANCNNNTGNTLSFVSARCNQGYKAMSNEWMIQDFDEMLTDTYEYVSDILEYEFDNFKK